MSIGSLMDSGPLLLAIPVAAAAGAVTFLSPCVLPLVPGYLSYITGMSGTSVSDAASAGEAAETSDESDEKGDANSSQAGRPEAGRGAGSAATATTTRTERPAPQAPTRRRAVAAAALFVLGFSVLFAFYGAAFGQISHALHTDTDLLTRILGVVLILLGLLFAGAFDKFSFAGRVVKPSFRPRAGLATAPLIGVLFGLGWTPCAGPTLTAVITLGYGTGTAGRSAFLAFVYALGVGIPFLIVAFAVDRGVSIFGFARRHARVITRVGGLLLIVVGLLEVTGAWSTAVAWLQVHWFGGYTAPI
jgi:cytochrome c-type biogenesis protein